MARKKPRLDPDRPRISRSYGRVSKIGERGKGGSDLWSPLVQIESGEAYFLRMGIPFDRQASIDYGDWDESAFDRPWKERPGIYRHYIDAKAGRLTDLSFYLLSRLGRDLAESLDLIAAFESAGCLLHFPNEGITPNTTGALDSGAKLLRNIRLALAESESEDKRLWSWAAAKKRAEAGKPIGQCPQWIKKAESGTVGPDGTRLNGYCPNEPIWSALRTAATMRLGLHSYTSITRFLNDSGYRTIEGHWWRTSTLQKYLSGTYIDTLAGTAFFNRYLPEGDPDRIVIENCYPAVISPAEAASLHALEKATKQVGNWATATTYLLTGKIRCPACGYAMLSVGGGKKDNGQKRAYHCKHCKDVPERDAIQKWISAYQVDDAVKRCIRYLVAYPHPSPVRRVAPKAPAKDALRELKERRRRLLQLHLQGMVDEGDYRADFEDLKKKIDALETTEPERGGARMVEYALNLPAQMDADKAMRSIVLAWVAKVEAPVVFPLEVRSAARITLKGPLREGGPTTYLAPLYRREWAGARNLYSVESGGEYQLLPPLPVSTSTI